MKTVFFSVTVYLMIFFSPLLSLILFLFTIGLTLHQQNYLVPLVFHAETNLAVIAVLVVGVALYVVGYRTNRVNELGNRLTFISGLLLIMWGTFTALIASVFYADLIEWSRIPGVREITVWDHLEYGSWMLKGILWIVSGILLTKTSNKIMKSKARLSLPVITAKVSAS